MTPDNPPPSADPAPPAPPVQPLALFEILVRENTDSLAAFLRAAVDDPGAADDLFQETLLVAWRRIGEYDRRRPFGAWLRGIARHLLLAHYRSAARRLTLPDERVIEHLDRRMAELDRLPGDTFDAKVDALRDCVERLAPLYREPVDLHYRQDRTAEWIAQRLATTKDAVQKRLQRARLLLADCLRRKGVLSPAGDPS